MPLVKLEETQNHLAIELLNNIYKEYNAYNKQRPIKELALEKLENMKRLYAHIEGQIMENNRQILDTRRKIRELEASQQSQ